MIAAYMPPMCDHRWLLDLSIVNHRCLRDEGHPGPHRCNCGATT